ncbi:type II secretion system F family protein [Clostridium sp. 19966]|uniref:type II secretion system F family protein n=1 Tax=Clostridium sp. 19966 TaxID=2768166 RepID=UPI0028DE2DF0|nr:type II secretion system F family protein [Clostridium sp. 19966]MDT8718569.1 type II secretion system F family protein [Clostridium sp. 19966]
MAYIPFIFVLIIIIVLYLLSKNKYEDEIKDVTKKEYSTKEVLPMGLFIVDLIGNETIKKVNNGALQKMLSMYMLDGFNKFRLYVAYKFSTVLIILDGIYFIMAAEGNFDLYIFFGGPLAAVFIYILMDSDLNKKHENRRKDIQYEFPDLLNKLILLVNAGLTVDKALERLVLENKKLTPLYYELNIVYKELSANKSKEIVFRDFSRRCKVQEITKFTSIILQNLNKGTTDIVYMLKNLSNECWILRKNMAKQRGEEASTRLLLPMMLMLVAIFMVILTPVFLQLRKI